jgi:hypothetical protein
MSDGRRTPSKDGAGGRHQALLVALFLLPANLSVFAQLRCIRGAEEGARILEGRPAVVAWMARVEAATAKPV